MAPLKNQRRELFAQALARGNTADDAYAQAGFSPNRGNAARLKANEDILARVAELQERAERRLFLTKQYVIDALIENAEKALGAGPFGWGSLMEKVRSRKSTSMKGRLPMRRFGWPARKCHVCRPERRNDHERVFQIER